MSQKFTICRVCGYDYKNYYPWGEDGNAPTYDFCDCCGIEFGNEDEFIKGIREERQKWIDGGMKWDRAKHKKSVFIRGITTRLQSYGTVKKYPSRMAVNTNH